MYARLARYEVQPDRIHEVVHGFEDAAGELEELEGLKAGYVLVDDQEGLALTLTLWETRAALEASAARAGILRQRAVKGVEGSVQAVHELEVALSFGDAKE
jgi:heme-degrading monooxygenase HmoA